MIAPKRVLKVLSERILAPKVFAIEATNDKKLVHDWKRKPIKRVSSGRRNGLVEKQRRNAIIPAGGDVDNSKLPSRPKSDTQEGRSSSNLSSTVSRVVKILQRNPLGRTDKETRFLFRQFRQLPAFESIQTDILKHIAGIVNVSQHPDENTVIFSQNEIGREWFVLLSGTLRFTLSRQGL